MSYKNIFSWIAAASPIALVVFERHFPQHLVPFLPIIEDERGQGSNAG
jgi:hypothetical protein